MLLQGESGGASNREDSVTTRGCRGSTTHRHCAVRGSGSCAMVQRQDSSTIRSAGRDAMGLTPSRARLIGSALCTTSKNHSLAAISNIPAAPGNRHELTGCQPIAGRPQFELFTCHTPCCKTSCKTSKPFTLQICACTCHRPDYRLRAGLAEHDAGAGRSIGTRHL